MAAMEIIQNYSGIFWGTLVSTIIVLLTFTLFKFFAQSEEPFIPSKIKQNSVNNRSNKKNKQEKKNKSSNNVKTTGSSRKQISENETDSEMSDFKNNSLHKTVEMTVKEEVFEIIEDEPVINKKTKSRKPRSDSSDSHKPILKNKDEEILISDKPAEFQHTLKPLVDEIDMAEVPTHSDHLLPKRKMSLEASHINETAHFASPVLSASPNGSDATESASKKSKNKKKKKSNESKESIPAPRDEALIQSVASVAPILEPIVESAAKPTVYEVKQNNALKEAAKNSFDEEASKKKAESEANINKLQNQLRKRDITIEMLQNRINSSVALTDHQQIKTELSRIVQDRDEHKKRADLLQEQIQKLVQNNLQSRFENISKVNESLKLERDNLKKRYDGVCQMADTVTDSKKRIEQDYADLKQHLVEVERKLSSFNEEKTNLQKQLHVKEANGHHLKQLHDNMITELANIKRERDELYSAMGNAKFREVADGQEEMTATEYQTELNNKERRINELEETLSKYSADLSKEKNLVQDFTNQMENLKNDLNKHQSETEQKENQLQEMKHDLQTKQNELNEEKSKFEKLSYELKETQQLSESKLDELKASISNMNASQSEPDVSGFEKKIQDLEQELQTKANELESSRQECSQLNTRIVDLQQCLDQDKSQSSSDIDGLKKQVTSLESITVKLQEENESLKGQYDNVLKDKENLSEQIEKNSTQYEEQFHKQKEILSNTEAMLAELQKSAEKEEQEKKSLLSEKEALNKEKESLTNELAQLSSQIEEQSTAYEQQIEKQKSCLAKTESVLEQLQSSVEEEQNKWKSILETTQNENASAIDEYKRFISEIQQSNESHKETVNQLNKEIESLKNSNKEFQDTIEELNRKIEVSQSELNEARLKDDLSSLKELLEHNANGTGADHPNNTAVNDENSLHKNNETVPSLPAEESMPPS